MIRQLRITLNGRVYEVGVEDVTATTGTHAPAGVTTMTPMPGPFVPPSKSIPAAAVPPMAASESTAAGPDDRVAPLGGVIVEILVKLGDIVEVDTPLVVLEAMKMKTVVGAHKAGRIAAIRVTTGQGVDPDQPLVTII